CAPAHTTPMPRASPRRSCRRPSWRRACRRSCDTDSMDHHDHLANAVAITDQIRDALEAEVERARGERGLIRAMDTGGLMRRAAARAEFNAAVARRQGQLG